MKLIMNLPTVPQIIPTQEKTCVFFGTISRNDNGGRIKLNQQVVVNEIIPIFLNSSIKLRR